MLLYAPRPMNNIVVDLRRHHRKPPLVKPLCLEDILFNLESLPFPLISQQKYKVLVFDATTIKKETKKRE
jgi:hypothetical protein